MQRTRDFRQAENVVHNRVTNYRYIKVNSHRSMKLY